MNEKEQKIIGAIVVDTERCKGCNLCTIACPTNAVELTKREVNSKGYHYATPVPDANCTGCTSCAVVCPDACITVYRAKTSEQK